jgi:hypothetical protein
MRDRNSPTAESYEELDAAYAFFNEALFGGVLPGCLITLQRRKTSFGSWIPERFVNRSGVRTDEIALNPEYFATRPVEDVLSTLVHEQCHQWRFRSGEPSRCGYHDRRWAAKMQEVGLIPSDTGAPGGKTVGEAMSHYIDPDGRFYHACKELLTGSFGIIWFDRYPQPIVKDYTYLVATEGAGIPASAEDISVPPSVPHEPYVSMPYASESTSTPNRPLSPIPALQGLDVVSQDSELGKAKATDSSNRTKYQCPVCITNVWGKPGLSLQCLKCHKTYQPIR